MKKYKPLTIVFYDFLQVFVYVSLFQSPTTTISEVTLSGLMKNIYFSCEKFYFYLCYWYAIKNIGSNVGIELGTPIFGVPHLVISF